MHDVAVALDFHQLCYAHSAEVRNPANIVAREIDEHDVLGAFLGIGQKFGGVSLILCGGSAARTCAREWANLDRIVNQPHMHLWRASNKEKICAESASRTDSSRDELETKHVRRRIDETKTSIKIERIAAKIGFEPL